MRKLIVLGLLLGSMTACAAADMTAGFTVTSPLAATALEPLAYAVETTDYKETAQAEDGTTLAEVCFALPEMAVLRSDGTQVVLPQNDEEKQALTVAETFNDHFTQWASAENFVELTQWAEEHYNGDPSFFTELGASYTEELQVDVRQIGNLVSVQGTYYTFTGGAHPNTVLLGWNFDLTTGTFVTPEVLAADGQSFSQAVQAEIIRQANQPLEDGTIPAEGYWENYEEIAAGWTSYAVFFDAEGMTVGFSPYELACYAAGAQSFTLSYETLRPYLSAHGVSLLGLEAE